MSTVDLARERASKISVLRSAPTAVKAVETEETESLEEHEALCVGQGYRGEEWGCEAGRCLNI